MRRQCALLAFVLLSSCAKDDESAVVATYNVGLASGYVDYASERRPLIAEAVAGLDVDIVCLEEVWTDEDVEAITTAAAQAFPYALYELTQDLGTSEPACTEEEATPLAECVETYCAEVPAENLATCGLDYCSAEYEATSSACQTCIAANLGQEFDAIFTACTEGSALYSYGGRNGLLLLSRSPLADTSYESLASTQVMRGVLAARTELPGIGAVQVLCTHLTADLSADLAYSGPYGTWSGENLAQVETLLELIAATETSRPVILLGDMNAGPEIGTAIRAENAGSYQAIVDSGFSSAFVEDPAVSCSFCAANPLVGAGDSKLIDHVFLKGATSLAATLFGTELTTISGDVEVPLSDHYGVRVEVR